MRWRDFVVGLLAVACTVAVICVGVGAHVLHVLEQADRP